MEGIDIKRFRQTNKINQQELADYLGVTRVYISQVETGRSNLSDSKVYKLLNNNRGWETEDLHVEIPTVVDRFEVDRLLSLLESQQEMLNSQTRIIEQQGATIQQLIDQQKEAARRDCPAGCAGVAGA